MASDARSHAAVVVVGISLLISLFTGRGYYLRDFALIASITLSPFGGVWLRRPSVYGFLQGAWPFGVKKFVAEEFKQAQAT